MRRSPKVWLATALSATIFGTGCAAVPASRPAILPVPAIYLAAVEKPVPPDSARPAVDALASTPEGRQFMGYVWRLSASWDLLYGDREAVRRLADGEVSADSLQGDGP